jgi:hypothetical protein
VLPGARGGQNAELGAEDNLGAAGTAELAEERLGCAVSVGARGVEEVDARVVCGGQSGKGLAAGGAAHHGGTAETEDRERGATDGKRDVAHMWTTLTRWGQGAADVAMTTSFGNAELQHFYVESLEVLEDETVVPPLAVEAGGLVE